MNVHPITVNDVLAFCKLYDRCCFGMSVHRTVSNHIAGNRYIGESLLVGYGKYIEGNFVCWRRIISIPFLFSPFCLRLPIPTVCKVPDQL